MLYNGYRVVFKKELNEKGFKEHMIDIIRAGNPNFNLFFYFSAGLYIIEILFLLLMVL